MLINKTVIMRWNSSNKNRFEEKGYIFTKMGDSFEIMVTDLQDKSTKKVDIECDGCSKRLTNVLWENYKRSVHDDRKYYCKKCASQLFGGENSRKTKLKNSISFHQWCYTNLTKEEADTIINRWSKDLNIDKSGKALSPKDVSYASHGINKNGYWFNCLDHHKHTPELKILSSFISGQKGSITCNQCNIIAITHPEFIKYFVNEDDSSKHSAGDGKKILMKCLVCGCEKSITFHTLITSGFGCTRCGNGISYPEKFLFSFLEQLLDKNFTTQLSKTTFTWCGKFKYDSYINKINCIIETHGLQHYVQPTGNWGLLKNTRENDKNKEDLARENGIENYIIIDCRKSELEWIKNNILISDLPKLLNFKEEDIDWLKCHESGCKNIIKETCIMWEGNMKNILKIADQLKLSKDSIRRYLKQGAKLGWCDYDPKEESKKRYERGRKK